MRIPSSEIRRKPDRPIERVQRLSRQSYLQQPGSVIKPDQWLIRFDSQRIFKLLYRLKQIAGIARDGAQTVDRLDIGWIDPECAVIKLDRLLRVSVPIGLQGTGQKNIWTPDLRPR